MPVSTHYFFILIGLIMLIITESIDFVIEYHPSFLATYNAAQALLWK